MSEAPPWYARPWVSHDLGPRLVVGALLRMLSGVSFIAVGLVQDHAPARIAAVTGGVIALLLGLTGLAAAVWQNRHPLSDR